jgi:hypothetical protein
MIAFVLQAGGGATRDGLAHWLRFLSANWHDWLTNPFARIGFAGSDIAPDRQGWFQGALASPTGSPP